MSAALHLSRVLRRVPMEPLIAVVGATGTGKSKLAVDLARHFNGEIINGDAMQLYRGLPIITNQIPVAERHGIPHHLISSIDLDQEPWRVTRFKQETLKVVDEIRSRGKLPILVGGTNYYIQAVLFHGMLVGDEDAARRESSDPSQDGSEKYAILNASGEEMLQRLREVDPEMAERWHPNEIRKIRRSLEIYLQTGRRASDIYKEQRETMMMTQRPGNRGSSEDGATDTPDEGSRGGTQPGAGQMRFPTLIFWTHTEKEALRTRLDNRVDGMVDSGLVQEAQSLFDYLEKKQAQGIEVDRTRGVWVSIGFKELEPYIRAQSQGNASTENLGKLKDECVAAVKSATRRYAKYQLKWIHTQFWTALATAGMTHRLYVVDTTEPSAWDRAVFEPARTVTEAFLSGQECPRAKDLSPTAHAVLTEREDAQRQKENEVIQIRKCDVCKVTVRTRDMWDRHVRSRGHKKALQGVAKRAQFEEYKKRMAAKLEADKAVGGGACPEDCRSETSMSS
ncbi:hypothetical protein VTO42DRAFT_6176 [Malbranchea cinnamomea]